MTAPAYDRSLEDWQRLIPVGSEWVSKTRRLRVTVVSVSYNRDGRPAVRWRSHTARESTNYGVCWWFVMAYRPVRPLPGAGSAE